MIGKEEDEIFGDGKSFRRQVRMAAVQVDGLEPDDLRRALAYEVEPFSGIAADAAEVAYRPIADADQTVRVYEVAVRKRVARSPAVGGLSRWLVPAYAMAAIALVCIAADWAYWHHRDSAAAGELLMRRPLDAQLRQIDAKIRQIQSEAAAILEKRRNEEKAHNEAAALRVAYSNVLSAMADAFGRRAVVLSIAAGEGVRTLRVTATAASELNAAAVMRDLTESASKLHWRLSPGSIEASAQSVTTRFDFTLAYDNDWEDGK